MIRLSPPSILRLGVLCLGLWGCASDSVMPDPDGVKVGRAPASEKCRDLGMISGTTLTEVGTKEEAVLDLKKEAANRGATYVMVKEFSSYGTTVTGQAFDCR